MNIKIKLIHKEAKTPSKATEGSTGYDLFSVEDAKIKPLERVFIPLGFKIEIPKGYDVQIRPRSGLAVKHGITVLNTPGTIDPDYRGEVKVILINLSNKEYIVKKGDRVAQMIISKVFNIEIKNVKDLTQTIRDIGGFGHTGL